MNKVKLLLAAAAALFAASALAQGVTATSIKIGQSAPLTGSNAELGQDIRNGALAYFKKINDAGGVNGRKIELVSLDDGNTVQRSGENTQKLVDEGVFALFGYASATLSRPALPIVEKNKVPFVHPFTGADPMRVFDKFVYNIRASYADELEKIVDHFAPLGVKRFAIVYYDDVVGRENLTAVDRALKKRSYETVSHAAFKDRVKPDIEGGVKAVAKGQPDVIILTTLYKHTSDFIKAAQKEGVGAQMASNSFPGASPLQKELGKDGPGVVIATVVPPFSKGTIPIVSEYRAAMEKFSGKKEFSFTSLESYIGAKVMVEGIKRAGAKPTREAFMHAMDGMSSYDVGGYIVGFSPNNHNGSSYVELTVISKDGQFRF
ncbi:MAG TPA: ABC transporter substrate-binding protein [Burkholderiales bacterium]|nr:ABC transporter substrate-binding protein [Burkholderiales bacterium]